MYRVRKYKKYYRKKNTNKDLFFPSSYSKSNHMTYYQKKGMIIQKSPRLVFNAPTEIMSKEKLDAYYRTLLAYKYQIPSPPSPPVPIPDINPFIISVIGSFRDIFISAPQYQFTSNLLQQIGDNYIQTQMGEIFSNYNFTYELYNIQINAFDNAGSNTQFHLDWNTSYYANPIQIFIKSVDAITPSATASSIISVDPNGYVGENVQFSIRRILINAGGNFSSSNITITSTDTEITDNGTYPFVTTHDNQHIADNLVFVLNSGSELSYGFRMFIICYASPK